LGCGSGLRESQQDYPGSYAWPIYEYKCPGIGTAAMPAPMIANVKGSIANGGIFYF
jgi:hypothetical protein